MTEEDFSSIYIFSQLSNRTAALVELALDLDAGENRSLEHFEIESLSSTSHKCLLACFSRFHLICDT